jgi:hypothetical protein
VSVLIIVYCDQPMLIEKGQIVGNCPTRQGFSADTVSAARGRATAAGWAQVGATDLCPAHNAARGLPQPPPGERYSTPPEQAPDLPDLARVTVLKPRFSDSGK